eukprot:724001_1
MSDSPEEIEKISSVSSQSGVDGLLWLKISLKYAKILFRMDRMDECKKQCAHLKVVATKFNDTCIFDQTCLLEAEIDLLENGAKNAMSVFEAFYRHQILRIPIKKNEDDDKVIIFSSEWIYDVEFLLKFGRILLKQSPPNLNLAEDVFRSAVKFTSKLMTDHGYDPVSDPTVRKFSSLKDTKLQNNSELNLYLPLVKYHAEALAGLSISLNSSQPTESKKVIRVAERALWYYTDMCTESDPRLLGELRHLCAKLDTKCGEEADNSQMFVDCV